MLHTLRVETDGSVCVVSLHRPDVRNAFNQVMIAELTELFSQLNGRPDVRVVVLRGSGRSFSAGADVDWMRSSLEFSREDNVADAVRMSRMFEAIDIVDKPVIARVHGAALGGGMGLLAVCDIVVAAEETIFGFTETKLGIIPAVISRFVVPRIGMGWSRALFLSGERFGPETARAIGLVHWIVPLRQLDACVEAKTAELLAAGPLAVAEAKHLLREVALRPEGEILDFTADRIASIRTGTEGQEGLTAFLEKRKPVWNIDG